MKKNYTKPNMLCEKIDSYKIITQTSPFMGNENEDGTASGNTKLYPVLAPKRRSIWDDED